MISNGLDFIFVPKWFNKLVFVVAYGDQLKCLVRNIFDELFNSVVNVTILLQ